MNDKAELRSLRLKIARALGYSVEFIRSDNPGGMGMLWHYLAKQEGGGTVQFFISGHIAPPQAYIWRRALAELCAPDWPNDAGAALALCMKSKPITSYLAFDTALGGGHWASYLELQSHKIIYGPVNAATAAEALSRLALAALESGADAGDTTLDD